MIPLRRCLRVCVCRLTVLALALAGGPLRAAAPPTDPPQGRFDETWMAVMLGGDQIGYAHMESLREQDNIRSTTDTVFRLSRAGTAVELRMTEGYTETLAGQPLAFNSEMVLGAGPIVRRGTIENGRIRVTTEQFGVQREQELDYPAGALMPWGAMLRQLQHPLASGTVLDFPMFVPSLALNVAVPTRTEIFEKERVKLLGVEQEAFRTRLTTTVNGVPVLTDGWIDEQWRPLKQTMKVMGLELEMVFCDKATALRTLTAAEMFVNTLIPIGQPLERDNLRSVTFLLAVEPGGKMPDLPATDMQEVVALTGHEVRVRVRLPDHSGLEAAGPSVPGPELAEFLSPTLFITSDDPQVRALAREAVGGETNPYRMADLLRRKVSETVRTVGLGTAFATAAEVCRKREGDCTENGVLLAALGRAVGIPSRVVTGLIYVPALGDRHDIMGFHMWTQFWIAGRWIDLDAAWDQTVCDPTHIALGTHSTQDDAIASLVSSVLLQVHELKISVVESEARAAKP